MTKRLVIYGVGQTSEVLSHLIASDESVEIVAYCNENKNSNQQFLEKPIVGLTDVKNIYDPNEHLFFVAIGYRNGNKIREIHKTNNRIRLPPLFIYSFPN